MDSLDATVLNTCKTWLDTGHAVTLLTVTKTWGSSPRPPGAMLAIRGDGQIVGSVSGGCIEDDLIERVRTHGMPSGAPQIITYGVSADEAHRFGLPCGGTLQLVQEPLCANSQIAKLCERINSRQLTRRTLDMHTGTVTLSAASADDKLSFDGESLCTLHGPQWRLLIIGGGQMSALLAQMAMALDYQVTVCDPREEHVAHWSVPGVTLVREMPDDTVIAMQPDARCAIVALTHDPKLDDMALLEALKSKAFYVGAIGSQANNARRRERLRLFDLSDEQIARLHGPVGLHIGSKIPAEIAVAILAHMTAVKNGVGYGS